MASDERQGGGGTDQSGPTNATAHTINTWTKVSLFASGTVTQASPFEAVSLSPGARFCGDSGIGTVRLLGSANAPVTWTLNGLDNDYAFVGQVLSVTGSSVDTMFTSGLDLADLEMCVVNTSQQTVTATFDVGVSDGSWRAARPSAMCSPSTCSRLPGSVRHAPVME